MNSRFKISTVPYVLVVLFQLLHHISCQPSGIDYSGKLYADYKIYTLGTTVDLYCNNTSQESVLRPNNTAPISWMLNLPNLTIITETMGRFEMSIDKWTFTIVNASKEDFGQYHCMMLDEQGEYYLITVGLNVEGPYFEDLGKKYDTNIMIAFCALGGFLVLACACILLYMFRYQADDDDDDDDSSDNTSKSSKDSKAPPGSEVIGGVPSVPGYTPFNTADGNVPALTATKDPSETGSTKSNGKIMENGGEGVKKAVVVAAVMHEADKENKENKVKSDDLELKEKEKEIDGIDNKAFEADDQEEKDKKDNKEERKDSEKDKIDSEKDTKETESKAEVHSSHNGSDDEDDDATKM